MGERGAEHPLLPIRGVQISNSAMETQRLPKGCFSPALKKLHPLLGASLYVPGAEQRVREESQPKLGESVAFGYARKIPQITKGKAKYNDVLPLKCQGF